LNRRGLRGGFVFEACNSASGAVGVFGYGLFALGLAMRAADGLREIGGGASSIEPRIIFTSEVVALLAKIGAATDLALRFVAAAVAGYDFVVERC
jgi:hypothetical protein